ncbi:N-acetyltransferase [Gordonia sp. (in: high G+C Gram-positive bacteria)]|uniref:N-acetyltransferase n=1 Tax=Gordonia sp. (in: high G+C Gram-positive bacteria) TaxID=84139 RepID=UPI003C76B323
MIRYEWCTHLTGGDAQQLRDLLVRAAAYDAEPEYNRIDPDEVDRDLAAGGEVRYLVIWLTERQEMPDGSMADQVAGVIRFVPRSDGWADGTIVIDPDFRSIGIVTLLLEREGTDFSADGGWLASGFAGVRGWARGNHPASGRIGDRNLLPRTRRIWKLVRPSSECGADDGGRINELTGADDSAVAALLTALEASDNERDRLAIAASDAPTRVALGVSNGADLVGVVDLDLTPVHIDDIGKCAGIDYLGTAPGIVGPNRGTALTDLLAGAGARAANAGLDGLIVYTSSADEEFVAVGRHLGFQHDRTDVLYEIH